MVEGDLSEPAAPIPAQPQEGTRDWTDLPVTVLSQILAAVEHRDTPSVRLVCRVWQACVDKLVSSLNLRAWPPDPSKLAIFPSLAGLCITGVAPQTAQQTQDMTGQLLKTLALLPNLLQLSLVSTRTSNLDDISLLTQLTGLKIDGVPTDDEQNFRLHGLAKLPMGLSELTCLRYLDVRGHVAMQLPAKVMRLTALEHLRITGHYYQSLKGLSRLTALTHLDLSSNMMVGLPEGVTKLSKLVYLNIRGSDAWDADDFWGNSAQLSKLEVLIADGAVLHGLPEGIGGFKALTYLSLVHNKLTELPDTMIKLTNLVNLNCRHNRLQELPPVLCKLPRLASLDLRDNELGPELYDNLGCLTSLTWLDASDNELEVFPASVSLLTNLERLDLAHNPFKDIAHNPLMDTVFAARMFPLYTAELKEFSIFDKSYGFKGRI